MVRAQHNQGEFAANQILLVFDTLICGYHHVKTLILSRLQKFAVDESIPPLFRRRLDFVIHKIVPQLIGHVFIK